MDETILTLDTSTAAGSVAVSRGETLLGEILLQVPATHTDRLLLTVRQILSDLRLEIGNIDAFGVVRGPGSFTGLRVGMATVKGLALATGKPVLALSSLQTLAVQAPWCRFPICTLLDARKQEVYAAFFRWENGYPSPLGEEAVLPPEKLLDAIEGETLLIGNGAGAYRSLICSRLGGHAHFAPWSLTPPRASHAAILALADFRAGRTTTPAQLAPHYLRLSEAEILWARQAAEPLIDG